MKDLQKIKEFFSKPVNEAIVTPMDAIEFLNANKDEIIKLADQYKGDVMSMQKAIDAFLAPHIEGTPDFIVNKVKAAIGGAISKRNIAADPKLSATYDKLKNVKGVVNEESPTQFKVGDKVTYLGHPGEITAVNKEMTGEITYSVAYDKGQGRTKASNINLKSGAIKPLKEAKTAVDMAKKRLDALGVKYEMSKTDKVRPFKVIYKPINKSDKFYDEFEDIVDLFNLKGFVKTSMDEAKFMSGILSGKDFINAKLKNYPKAVAKVNQLINMIGEDKFTIEIAEWIFDFFNNAHFESPMNESKEESLYKNWDQFEKPSKIKVYLNNDKTLEITPLKLKGGKRVYDAILQAFIDDRFDITNKVIQGMTNNLSEAKEEDIIDTITMDIPLFLRMLEYSREDAKKDLDLHDVTEKAISLGKERGILQMDDYDELIGSAEEMKEGELTEAYVPSNIREFAKRRGVSSLVNKVAGWAEKVGKSITGGTAIGYGYNTLVLDMEYQSGEIRINIPDETIELYDEPVRNFNEFQRVYADGEGNNLEEIKEEQLFFINKARAKSSLRQFLSGKRDDGMGKFDAIVYGIDADGKKHQIKYYNDLQNYEKFALGDNPNIKENVAPDHDGKAAPYGSGYKPLEERIAKALEQINEELCPAGKAYIKRRQAAGEKSSAYLSGRAVKVCKGQMSGRAKKK